MMRVVTTAAALVLTGGLVVGCQGDIGKNPPEAAGGASVTPKGDATSQPPPPPAVERTRPATTRPPTSTPGPTASKPTATKPSATRRKDVALTQAQGRSLVSSVALVPQDWGPTYVQQEVGYEWAGLEHVVTGTDCTQVDQGTIPGGIAAMARQVYIPDGEPSVDNLSKTLAASSATVYSSTAQAKTDIDMGVADARRCPDTDLGVGEWLKGIEVLDLEVPGVDQVHVARASWSSDKGGKPFRYVWVTARQGQMVLTAAVVDRGDKTFESAKNQAIDALALMIARTDMQLG